MGWMRMLWRDFWRGPFDWPEIISPPPPSAVADAPQSAPPAPRPPRVFTYAKRQ